MSELGVAGALLLIVLLVPSSLMFASTMALFVVLLHPYFRRRQELSLEVVLLVSASCAAIAHIARAVLQ